MVLSWWKKLLDRKPVTSRPARKSSRGFSFSLEQLEERALLNSAPLLAAAGPAVADAQAITTTVLTDTPAQAVFGQTVTLKATVTGLPPLQGAVKPTGDVVFKEGGLVLGHAGLKADGTAVLKTSALPVGTDSITAVYQGDGRFTGSTSKAVTEKVSADRTAVKLVSSYNPAQAGQPVTFTATVTAAAPGAGKPTGTVVFMQGGKVLGQATIKANGKAVFTTSTLAVGTDTITAVYKGSTNFKGSTSAPLAEVIGAVTSLPSVTKLTAAPAQVFLGQKVTLTASVAGAAPFGIKPTGTVYFLEGGKLLGQASVGADGKARLPLANLSVGTHTILAVYHGDSHFATSSSATVSVRVLPPVPVV